MTINFEEFSKAQISAQNLENITFDFKKAVSELTKELKVDFEDLNTDKVKKLRHEYFKIPATVPDDFAERFKTLDEKRAIIYGIRHENLVNDRPYIRVLTNFEINSKDDALEIYKSIKDEFKVFKATRLSIDSGKNFDWSRKGMVTLFGKMEDIKKADNFFDNTIELAPVRDEYYDWYISHYNEFHKERPDLKDNVNSNSKEIMDESFEQGLLYYALLNGERVGLIAAESESYLGQKVLYFNEILIIKNFRGQGLGKDLQRRFIKKFENDFYGYYGTIHYNNHSSFQTALRNQRFAISYEYFIEC